MKYTLNYNNMDIQHEYKQHIAKRKELKSSSISRIAEIRSQINNLHVEEAYIETILSELSE
jgi:hypothetical protein|tara:strand:- start:6 stop:188 length:183 start_codon:yes stop_codon:yes gene_type:complete